MKEIIECPICKQATINVRRVYPPEEIKKTSLEEYAKQIVEQEGRMTAYPYSTTAGNLIIRKAIQIVFECSTCGFTKVSDVK